MIAPPAPPVKPTISFKSGPSPLEGGAGEADRDGEALREGEADGDGEALREGDKLGDTRALQSGIPQSR